MFDANTSNTLIALLIGVALSGGSLALLAWALPKLAREKQGYPYEQELEALILPYAYKAVAAAYEMAERAFVEVGEVLDGADKKAFADGVYRYLPDGLKRWVSPDEWGNWVQRAYDESRNLRLTFWQGFEKEFQAWREAWETEREAA